MLLDLPRFRGVKWLEPGEAVTRAELEACEAAQRVHLGEGDIFVYRTGPHRRRWSSGHGTTVPDGEGKAGLHVDTIPWMHERGIAAFLPDGDGEAIPSCVAGIAYPIHPLQITAMGMLTADSLQLEDLARACEEEGRFEFMVVGLPLRLPGGTARRGTRSPSSRPDAPSGRPLLHQAPAGHHIGRRSPDSDRSRIARVERAPGA